MMRSRLHIGKFAAIAIVALLNCISSGRVHAADMNAALKELAAAATQEGTLTLSWNGEVFGGSAGARLFEAGIAKAFGATIHINFVPGSDPARIANQMLTEYQAGQKASVDILLGSAAQMSPLSQRDFFLPVDWHQYMPDRVGPDEVEADNKIIRIGTTLSGFTYNNQLAPMKPTRLEDFLKPEWKGRIASTPYAAGFDVLLSDDMWGVKRTLDYVTALSKQIAGLIRCGENERLANGEYLAIVMDCSGQTTTLWQAKGAPLDYVLPPDATSIRYYYFGLPKNIQHPNAAKLYTLFTMTEEGQKLVWQTWAMDLHKYPGSHTREQIAAFEKAGGKATEVTVAWWQKQAGIDENKGQLVKILSTK